jgi:beta-phosphoglucomutase-like phosphatase (HAD superfamily)
MRADVVRPACATATEALVKLIVFDFDGVVADSEVLANTVLAEFVTELGVPMSLDDSLRTFMGKRLADVLASIGELTGRPMPAASADDFWRRTLARFRTDLQAIDGVRGYLAATAGTPRCIASSSTPERLAACLDILALADAFGPHVYSATHVPRGKPHPHYGAVDPRRRWHASLVGALRPRYDRRLRHSG